MSDLDLGAAIDAAYEEAVAVESEDIAPESVEAEAILETDEKAPEAAEIESDQGNDDEGEPPAVKAELEPLAPAERWSADVKERFATLPREAQEILLERERDVTGYLTQESQKIAEQRRELEPVLNVFEQRKQVAAQNGMTPQQEFGMLYQISEFAAKSPAEYIQWFAQQRGIDLEQLALGGEVQTDPEVAALKQEVGTLKQTLTQQQQYAQQAETAKMQAVVDSFSSNVTDFPHFKQLESEIIAFIPLAKQANPGGSPEAWLKDAYDRAAWANPTVRESVMKSQQAQQTEAARKAQQEAADKAKKAAGLNVKKRQSEGEVTVSTKGLPLERALESTLQEAFNKVSGAA